MVISGLEELKRVKRNEEKEREGERTGYSFSSFFKSGSNQAQTSGNTVRASFCTLNDDKLLSLMREKELQRQEQKKQEDAERKTRN